MHRTYMNEYKQLDFSLLHSSKGKRQANIYTTYIYTLYHSRHLVTVTEAHNLSSVHSGCVFSVWNVLLYPTWSITNYCQFTIVSSITVHFSVCCSHLYAHISSVIASRLSKQWLCCYWKCHEWYLTQWCGTVNMGYR